MRSRVGLFVCLFHMFWMPSSQLHHHLPGEFLLTSYLELIFKLQKSCRNNTKISYISFPSTFIHSLTSISRSTFYGPNPILWNSFPPFPWAVFVGLPPPPLLWLHFLYHSVFCLSKSACHLTGQVPWQHGQCITRDQSRASLQHGTKEICAE